MDSIRWLFGAKRPLGYIEGDDVYPTHVFDNHDGVRPFVMAWTLCFNDVLDPVMIHQSLCRLVSIGDWRKFGGRLRVGKGRTLELHVPPAYTAERPAVTYTHKTFDIAIEEHPLASKLPKPTDERMSFHVGPDDFRDLAVRPDVPETIEDLTTQEIPILGLNILSFNDATLVSLSFPHVIMDAMGQSAFLEAWSQVLNGREDQVPALMGAKKDVLYNIGDPDRQQQTKSVLEDKALTGWSLAKFVVRLLWDMVWDRQMDNQTVFLPKKMVDKLRADQLRELAEKTPVGEDAPWISEGDALLGFFGQQVARSNQPNRPMLIASSVDVRHRLGDALSKDGVYVQNMMTGCLATVSADEAMGPASGLAMAYRKALAEQTTVDQAIAIVRLMRKTWDTGASAPAMFGDPDQSLFIVTNWTRGHLMQAAKFGPAVIRAGAKPEDRANPPGELCFQHAQPLRPSMFSRNIVAIMGKDHEGNYWVMGYLKPRTWALVRKSLEELAAADEYTASMLLGS